MYMMANYNGKQRTGILSLSTDYGSGGLAGGELGRGVSQSTTNTWASKVTQNFAPQLGSNTKIGVFDARMNTLVYRNGSLWATHTVFVPAAHRRRSAVDWWQVGTDGSVQQFGRLQDPNSVNFYVVSEPCGECQRGHAGGISRMSASSYASGAYAFRAASGS